MARSAKRLADPLHDLENWGGKVARTDRVAVGQDEPAELALARAVEIAGEITGRLLLQAPARWSEEDRVDLRNARAMRNRPARGYDSISPELLFDVATQRVPMLTAKARRWLAELPPDDA